MPREKFDNYVLSRLAMEKIIRKAGADRVSESAKVALGELLEKVGVEISKMAVDNAIHAKRVTIKDDDIKLAHKQWLTAF